VYYTFLKVYLSTLRMLVSWYNYTRMVFLLVSESADSTIKMWKLSTGQATCTFTGDTGDVPSVALSADGAILVNESSDYTIKVWEA
jgi:WD40 repeat protein